MGALNEPSGLIVNENPNFRGIPAESGNETRVLAVGYEASLRLVAMIPIPYALDAVNFLAADVRNLFGPFVNVFLVTAQHWSQTDVGLLTTASGLLGIALQTPIGAAIDVTRAKRGVIVLTMAAMTVGAIIIFVSPSFWPMALALSVLAVAADAFAPAVSALTLGLVTRDQLARRLGRNSAYDHGGNIAIALLAGAVGYAFSQRAVFLMVPVFAALTCAAVLAIPARAINHDRARDHRWRDARRRRRLPRSLQDPSADDFCPLRVPFSLR
jgi:MFS family permease